MSTTCFSNVNVGNINLKRKTHRKRNNNKKTKQQNKNETKQLAVARMSDDRRYHFCVYCKQLYEHHIA